MVFRLIWQFCKGLGLAYNCGGGGGYNREGKTSETRSVKMKCLIMSTFNAACLPLNCCFMYPVPSLDGVYNRENISIGRQVVL